MVAPNPFHVVELLAAEIDFLEQSGVLSRREKETLERHKKQLAAIMERSSHQIRNVLVREQKARAREEVQQRLRRNANNGKLTRRDQANIDEAMARIDQILTAKMMKISGSTNHWDLMSPTYTPRPLYGRDDETVATPPLRTVGALLGGAPEKASTVDSVTLTDTNSTSSATTSTAAQWAFVKGIKDPHLRRRLENHLKLQEAEEQQQPTAQDTTPTSSANTTFAVSINGVQITGDYPANVRTRDNTIDLERAANIEPDKRDRYRVTATGIWENGEDNERVREEFETPNRQQAITLGLQRARKLAEKLSKKRALELALAEKDRQRGHAGGR